MCCPLAEAGARVDVGVGVVVGGEGEGGGGGGEAPGGGGGCLRLMPCSSCSSLDHTAGAAALGPSLKHFWGEKSSAQNI